MIVVVYTAAFGTTDQVRAPLVVDPDAEYLCFTDGPLAPAPYETIRMAGPGPTPFLSAKRIKILADHRRLEAADLLVWHDASYKLLRTVRWAVRRLAECDLVAMRHARRDRIEDEALAIARYRYVTSSRAEALVAGYRAEGFDLEGLSSGGLIGSRASAVAAAFRATWWAEALKWAGRDQGCLDYSAWKAGARIGYVKGNHRANPYAAWRQPGEAVA
ncbi:MAG: hypothetical protein V4597_08610 [Pseudomonadota bacterium]